MPYLADVKKHAATEGRTIVFVDESGLSERPHRVRTGAPRGQTPVLQLNFNGKVWSAIAGITLWNFYFRLYRGTIKGPPIIDFLGHLRRQLDRKLLIRWEGLAAPRRHRVRKYVGRTNGQIRLAPLPAYAPELNPVEFIGGYCKHHELPNFCPRDFAPLNQRARNRLRRMQRRPKLVTAFWHHAELPL